MIHCVSLRQFSLGGLFIYFIYGTLYFELHRWQVTVAHFNILSGLPELYEEGYD